MRNRSCTLQVLYQSRTQSFHVSAHSLERLTEIRLRQMENGRKKPRDRVYSAFAARCFQFLSKIDQFCVGIKSQNYFALFSSMSSFFQGNINANLTFAVCRLPFAVNAILNLSIIMSGIVTHGSYDP